LNGPRLGVLLSGSGRTLQNLIDRIAAGRLDAAIACVIADRELAFGLRRAADAGLPHHCLQDPAAIWRTLNPSGTRVTHDEYRQSISPMTPSSAKRLMIAT